MKNNLFVRITLGAALLATSLTSCKKEEILEQDGSVKAAAIVEVGTCNTDFLITTNTTWEASNIYILRGKVRVLAPATLTIEAGTVIQGECDGTLIVERDGRIVAEGTAANPIVFTSNQPAGQKKPGDWGGVVILGRANNNQAQNVAIEGVVVGLPSNNSLGYHGPGDALNNADDSGILRYVRIEYAGQALTENNEINALTLGSVGNGTTIDHIQVLYANDDAFEWFGGTVNATYLYAYGSVDDDFDTDFGYTGKVQFAASVRVNSQFDVVVPTGQNSNGFESDNDAIGSSLTPLTNPRFANVTLVGPTGEDPLNFGSGLLLRRNTALDLYNSIIFGWGKTGTGAIRYSGANPPCTGVSVKSTSIQNYSAGTDVIPSLPTCFTIASLLDSFVEPATGTADFTAISLIPAGGTANGTFTGDATGGTTFPGFPLVSTAYRGAFGPDDSDNANWNLNDAWLSFKLLGE